MEGGPPGFGRGFTCPALLGIPVGPAQVFGYGAFTLSGPAFQRIRLTSQMPRPGPATPECKHSGLASSPFARRYLENRCFFLFLGLLRCFSSPRFLLHAMCSHADAYPLQYAGSPIRKSAVHQIFAPHRSLSQLVTSFVGFRCQGIRLMLFLT